VDSVYKGAVLKEMGGNEVKEEAAGMVAKENDVRVHKIQWLSKHDTGKIHGSMVLYLARSQDAEKLLRDRRVEVDGETAFARPYERRTGPMRCFKCHQFNHVAPSAHHRNQYVVDVLTSATSITASLDALALYNAVQHWQPPQNLCNAQVASATEYRLHRERKSQRNDR
jgi:hypothetical protein